VSPDEGVVIRDATPSDARAIAEVLTIYLLPAAAGRGIGRDLFASAVERIRASGFDRATLWVMASNARSRRFYEAAG
jgi:ribosomal protein S18 acetylase RimI-like enzyme